MGRSTTERGSLTPEFVNELQRDKRLLPKLELLANWLESKGFPGRLHTCSGMLRGDPVDWQCIEGLFAYFAHLESLEKERFGRFRYREIKPDISKHAVKGVLPEWRLGWNRIQDVIEHGFRINPLSDCNENDIKHAARISLVSTGCKVLGDDQVSDDTAISVALKTYLGDSLRSTYTEADYISWITNLHIKNPRTVVFAVAQPAGHRVGVSIVLPLTRDAYLRTRAGQIAPLAFSPDDITSTVSNYIWVGHIAEVMPREFADRDKIGKAQMNSMLYQIAALTPKQHPDEPGPTLLTMSVHPEGRARCLSFGFKDIGRCNQVGLQLMEISWNTVAGLDAFEGMYLAMGGLLLSSQRAQRLHSKTD